MSDKLKSKIYLLVFLLTAGILGWGVWANYRPQIILASCTDIAESTGRIYQRASILDNQETKYDEVLHECLRDAGI